MSGFPQDEQIHFLIVVFDIIYDWIKTYINVLEWKRWLTYLISLVRSLAFSGDLRVEKKK
jgi:hypothetical protein